MANGAQTTPHDDFEKYCSVLKEAIPYVEDDTFTWDDVIGLLIIQLKNTDSLNKASKKSHATQIQITSEKDPTVLRSTEDFFPTLTLNSSFKSWRISIPTRIHMNNINQLKEMALSESAIWLTDSVQIRRRILNDDGTGYGNPNLQICYGNDLMPLRELLNVGDYLVLAKRKNLASYEAFGVRGTIDLGSGKKMHLSTASSSDSSIFSLGYVSEYTDSEGTAVPDTTASDNEARFRTWMATQNSAAGGLCSPGTISNNCSALKKVCSLMDIAEYPNMQSLFEISDLDQFCEIALLIRSHPNYEKVNIACGNKYLNTGLNWYEKYLTEISATDPIEEEPVYPGYSKEDFLSEVFMTSEQYDELVNLLEYKKNIILQGAPGVGKTFLAKRLAYSILGKKDPRSIDMVQFHQSYSYEDFIMGYRPNEAGFELTDGVFYSFCKTAGKEQNKSKKYFFIIDEINRGNLSKIFGELLMLIEGDKRTDSIKLVYKNELFSVPENVYIIGMMNTADRSLALMDYALRRRFSFFDVEPAFDKEVFKKHLSSYIKSTAIIDKVIARFNTLNDKIADADTSGLGKGFCIGHSYFCTRPVPGQSDEQWYHSIIKYEIIPLLEEYWWDDKRKVDDCVKALLKD